MSVKEKTWLNLWNLFLGSVRAAVTLHQVVFIENPLKGVSTENMPLFLAQSLSLHVPTEVTKSISETSRTRSRATGSHLSTAQGYNTFSVSRPGG